jgi:hypothetical protein
MPLNPVYSHPKYKTKTTDDIFDRHIEMMEKTFWAVPDEVRYPYGKPSNFYRSYGTGVVLTGVVGSGCISGMSTGTASLVTGDLHVGGDLTVNGSLNVTGKIHLKTPSGQVTFASLDAFVKANNVSEPENLSGLYYEAEKNK